MTKVKKSIEKYDLVCDAKTSKFAIYAGPIEIFTFFGIKDLAIIYNLPDSIYTIDAFNVFVDKVKQGSLDVIMHFKYCDLKDLYKAKEYAKKDALLLKVKFNG